MNLRRSAIAVLGILAVWGMLSSVVSATGTNPPAQRKVIGHLGQTIEPTFIYQRPAMNARVFYRPKAYEYLVVNPGPNETWMRVVMSNGQTGYIRASTVARLPYEVTIDPSQGRTGAAPTLGNRADAASWALNYIGTPYKWGGNDPNRGIDCSGFVKYLYGRIGVELPRTAAQQVNVGKPILNFEDLQVGDRLYFWDRRRNRVGHTGIYLGNGWFVHSSSSRRGVATDQLAAPQWRNTLVAARR
ncbi:MAG: C40 family peptidase [Fimbriimonadaceae bacterium]